MFYEGVIFIMKKYGIVILADVTTGSKEALGRVLNALVLANDLFSRGDDVKVFFQGAGTRCINVLEESSHLGHVLYKNIKDKVCASKACSSAFGANVTTVPLLSEFEIKDLGGATSLAKYIHDGYSMVSF